MILLDTHVYVWLNQDPSRLGRSAQRHIEVAAKRGEVAVSIISFWEISFLASAGRLRLPRGFEAMRADGAAAGIAEVPVDTAIAFLAGRREGLHGDPADRLVFATALERTATLVTADEKLLSLPGAPERIDAQR